MGDSRADKKGSNGAQDRRRARRGQLAQATSSISRLGGWWDEPAEWAVTVFKSGDRRVRIHVLFLIFAVLLIADAAWPRKGERPISDVVFAAIGVGAVLVAAVWHEAGHALAHRLIGGQLYETVIWPLGGLDTARPNKRWIGQFVSAIGGPFANLIAASVLTAFLLTQVENRHHVLFNPFEPWLTYARWSLAAPSWFLIALWWLNYANLMLGVSNLLPVYPLDGADMFSSLVWARSNQRRAIEVTTSVGYIGSFSCLVIGLGSALPLLVACSLFCWFVCWQHRRRLAFIEGIDPPSESIVGELEVDVDEKTDRVSTDVPEERLASETPAASLIEESADDESVVDAVLAKVSDRGMSSLTDSERAILQRATQRRREGGRQADSS